MRKILIQKFEKGEGRFTSIPVKVSWPELQLTDNQIVANTIARLDMKPEPFPDNSYIEVRIEN